MLNTKKLASQNNNIFKMKKIIYDGRGHQIGSINDIGDMIHAYNKHGKPVGLYNKKANMTVDISGRKIANGNLAEALVLMMALK